MPVMRRRLSLLLVPASALFLCSLLGPTVPVSASRTFYGRTHGTAAIFGNLLNGGDQERGDNDKEEDRSNDIPPPPPPLPPKQQSSHHGSDAMGLQYTLPHHQHRLPPPVPPTRDASLDDDGNNTAYQDENSAAATVDPTQTAPLPHIPAPPDVWGVGPQQQQQHQVPPPPPFYHHEQQQQQQHEPLYHPPPTHEAWRDDGVSGGMWESQPPPPMASDAWMSPEQQKQQQQPYASSSYSYEHDLEESLQRQQDLLLQNLNLSRSILQLEQREDLQTRQLDVLTERIMDVEARSAMEHNQLLEYQQNCTMLSRQAAELQGLVEEWKIKCNQYVEQHEEDAKELKNLQKDLKRACLEAEELASLIERHRLAEEDTDDESSSGRLRKKKKKVGFFAWLFGWGSNNNGSDSKNDRHQLDEVYETGRTTLLTALQTERNNVEELEAAVASLQHNNSAISEQVQSRDLIIDELNDRIAVFEEDKIVLKAALRQLQKEMSEEAPKTQQLIQDLEAARNHIDLLQLEIESLLETHQEELAALQMAIANKDETLVQTESNLTVIGTYVDRLEGRLADFAVARRDMERREQQCLDMEKSAKEAKRERDLVQTRALELEKDHEELKKLIQEMASARQELMSKNQRLTKEQDALRQEEQKLQTSLSKLRSDYESLEKTNLDLQVQVDQYKSQSNDTEASTALVQQQLQMSESTIEDLRRQVNETMVERQELFDKIQQAEAAATLLREEFTAMEESKRVLLAERLQDRKELTDKLHQAEEAKRNLQQELAAMVEETRQKIIEIEKQQATAAANDYSNRIKPIALHLADLQPNVTRFVHRLIPSLAGSPPGARDETKAVAPAPPVDSGEAAKKQQSMNASDKNKTLASSNITLPEPAKPAVPPPIGVSQSSPGSVVSPGTSSKGVPPSHGGTVRQVRKFFAKATGLHGAFTKDYKKTTPTATETRVPPEKKAQGKTPPTQQKETAPTMPESQLPRQVSGVGPQQKVVRINATKVATIQQQPEQPPVLGAPPPPLDSSSNATKRATNNTQQQEAPGKATVAGPQPPNVPGDLPPQAVRQQIHGAGQQATTPHLGSSNATKWATNTQQQEMPGKATVTGPQPTFVPGGLPPQALRQQIHGAGQQATTPTTIIAPDPPPDSLNRTGITNSTPPRRVFGMPSSQQQQQKPNAPNSADKQR